MAVTMYNAVRDAVREFMSRRYPKKGKKGIGNKNTSHDLQSRVRISILS